MGARNRLTRVWPLRPGVMGVQADLTPVELTPGRRGFMPYDEAVEAQGRGEVQLMVGVRPQDLKKPTYSTASVLATPPEDLDSVVDEEPDIEFKSTRKVTKKKVAAKRTYNRRDLKAET